MATQKRPAAKIEYVDPPPIKVYQVYDQQLDQLEEASSQVGHDFSFALASLSIGITTLVTRQSISQLTPHQRMFFSTVAILSAVVFLYTGIRWFGTRNVARNVIDDIRNWTQPED